MGDKDGGNPWVAQFSMVVQDLVRPRAVRLPGIDHYHVVLWVAHKVNVGASRMHRPKTTRVFFDVSGVDVLGDLHGTVLTPFCARGGR